MQKRRMNYNYFLYELVLYILCLEIIGYNENASKNSQQSM